MAGTLLHITLANKALDAAAIPKEAESELRRCIDDYRLGAVLVDLPYYENLWLKGIRILAGFGIQYGVWGSLLHMRSPLSLACALMDRSGDAAGRSLALGFATHLAVDIVFHQEICRQVMREADGSIGLESEHKRIEDEIDLHAHYHLLEHPGIGTPYARRMFTMKPEPSWPHRFGAAITEVHGSAPDDNRLRRWLKELSLFGWVNSSSKVPWVKTLPKDNPELLQTSIELTERAIRLSSKYIEASLAYLNGDMNRQSLEEIIPDRSMLDGSQAEPAR